MQLGNIQDLKTQAVKNLLNAERFKSNQGATFRVNQQTFLAINDTIKGFQPNQDALIELTGYSGDLKNLAIHS